MYAVVTTGGKQYRVEAGSELIIEQLGAEAGASITFDRVLLVGDGDAVTVGTPTVDGASVSATVLGESLGPKLIIFKFKQKATYRRKNGHRQHMIRVRIDEINASGKKAKSKAADAPAEAEAKADAEPEKPKRARKPAVKATQAETDAPEKPKRTRKPAAKKTESEE
jgi:large subunit ribosomal protein L21